MAVAAPAERYLTADRPGLRRLTTLLLWLTIFAGAFVLFEPAPYEGVFALLCAVVAIRSIAIPSLLALPIGFIALWLSGGIVTIAVTGTSREASIYLAISAYLALSAVVFAALVADRPDKTLGTVRHAYVAAGVVAALAGIAGYFHLVPGSGLFLLYDRAKGPFEDPNVFAPFLVLPTLLLVQDVLDGRLRRLPVSICLLAILLAGVLLSFSRAAWGHLAVSVLVMAALLFVASKTNRFRVWIVGGGLLTLLAAAIVIVALLAIPGVRDEFLNRADLFQDYDTGVTGRFGNQLRSIPLLLENPLGFGPYKFGERYGMDPHNVYLNAFATYGWLGGLGYLGLVVATWIVGARLAMVRAPWQKFHIAAFAAYVGVSLEGLVIDTDHWRHYFLLAGLVWGLSAATLDYRRGRAT